MKEKFDGVVTRLLDAGVFLEQAVEILEKRMIQGAMERAAGNQTSAAKSLGIHRNTLQNKLVEYGLGSARKPPARQGRAPRRKTGTR